MAFSCFAWEQVMIDKAIYRYYIVQNDCTIRDKNAHHQHQRIQGQSSAIFGKGECRGGNQCCVQRQVVGNAYPADGTKGGGQKGAASTGGKSKNP